MKVEQLIKELVKQGYQIKYRRRSEKEGSGIRITSINGVHYTGSRGNVYARALLGEELSAVQRRHLESIKTPKKQFGSRKQNLLQVDEETKKKIRRIQAKFRKRGIKEGVPTLRNYRYVMKTYGKAEADRLLEGAERYSKGTAYLKNIETLIARMNNDLTIVYNEDIAKSRDIIQEYYNIGAPNFTDDELMIIYELLYNWEQSKGDNTLARYVYNYVVSLKSKWKLG